MIINHTCFAYVIKGTVLGQTLWRC